MSALFALDPDELPAQPTALRPDQAPLATSPTTSLYRKYRPQSFDDAELVGQETIVRTLRNAIRLDRVAHAYLFCGPRGTGKTTTARVLAKAVNCLDPDSDRRPCNVCASCRAIAAGATTDVVEIDAASNRGIDDIRDLRERARYAPAQLRTKFYIVDEAHQITGAAANAFLKTLEEPPPHTKFVLATTDPEELLPTIVSRCQRFDFRRIGAGPMAARLRTVATAERIPVDEAALAVIARHAGGSLRDALGLLDQLALYQDQAPEDGEIGVSAVLALLGVSRNDRVEALASALAERDAATALRTVNAAVEAGVDPRALNRELVNYLRLLLHERAGGADDADPTARSLAARFSLGELADLARRFGEIDARIRHSPYPQLPLEVALVEGALRSTSTETPAEADIKPPDYPPAPARVLPVLPVRPERPVDPPPGQPSGPSLRDRVRGSSAPPAPPPQAFPDPAATRPAPPSRTPTPDAPPDPPPPMASAPIGRDRNGAPVTIDVEHLVDLWPRVRQDVKAVNRRIEALLSSVDPIAVSGANVTLAAAYEFHRDKLNTDDVRTVVESAMARLVGAPVLLSCVLRSQGLRDPAQGSSGMPPLPSAPPAISGPADPPRVGLELGQGIAEPPRPDDSVLDADDRRLRAAKNIFDAEEIDPDRPRS